jgi:hypothetical protein
MAKEKLFPPPEKAPDKREPHERFTDFASQIVKVSKADIDKREKQWQKKRPK